MCDFDVNKVYVKKIRVAKKVHRCCECNIRILSNQKYNYIRGGVSIGGSTKLVQIAMLCGITLLRKWQMKITANVVWN